MGKVQQTYTNDKEKPIYISVEPWPECFELERGDKLTLVYNADETGSALDAVVINDQEIVLWPNGSLDGLVILFNGEPSDGRSWKFKHR